MPHIKNLVMSFMPTHMRGEIKELYFSTLILNVGIMMVQLFEPIYLFTLGYSLTEILWFFLIVYLAYFLLMPLGAHFAKRFGYEHSIIASTFIFILYYYFFYSIAREPSFFYFAAVLYAVQKTLYWPAYHSDFARYSARDEESREIGGIVVAVSVASIIAPLLAGVVLKFWGFGVLFMLVSLLFVASNIPLITTKEIFVPGSFSYREAYRQLFFTKYKRELLSYLGFGEELIVMVVWPIYMLVVFKDFLNIGAATSIGTLLAIMVTLYIARVSDSGQKRRALRTSVLVYAAAWFARLFTSLPITVFAIDSISRISKYALGVPLTAITYEHAQDRKVMHTVIFFEMSLVLGKLIALAVLIALLAVVPQSASFGLAFVLGGLMTLLYLRLK